MTNAFNWRADKRETPKEFKTRNDKPGKLPPMVFPGTPVWKAPKTQGAKK